jgi:hypothetical protein
MVLAYSLECTRQTEETPRTDEFEQFLKKRSSLINVFHEVCWFGHKKSAKNVAGILMPRMTILGSNFHEARRYSNRDTTTNRREIHQHMHLNKKEITLKE